MGEEVPEDRKMFDMAVDLYHATRTGQFPFPGVLRDQPSRLAMHFRLMLGLTASRERIVTTPMGATVIGGGKGKKKEEEIAHYIGDPTWVDGLERHGLEPYRLLAKYDIARRDKTEDKFWAWLGGDGEDVWRA